MYDDDKDETKAIVYFTSLSILSDNFGYVQHKHLSKANFSTLTQRQNEIIGETIDWYNKPRSRDERKIISLLEELTLVQNLLINKIISLRFKKDIAGTKIFISHSSLDNKFAIALSIGLAELGFNVFVDKLEIKIGDSISGKISEGIDSCEFMIVILSKNSVKSNWVKAEWSDKYFEEITSNRVCVLPVVIDECEIPALLRSKRHLDFTKDFDIALFELMASIINQKTSEE